MKSFSEVFLIHNLQMSKIWSLTKKITLIMNLLVVNYDIKWAYIITTTGFEFIKVHI